MVDDFEFPFTHTVGAVYPRRRRGVAEEDTGGERERVNDNRCYDRRADPSTDSSNYTIPALHLYNGDWKPFLPIYTSLSFPLYILYELVI